MLASGCNIPYLKAILISETIGKVISIQNFSFILLTQAICECIQSTE